MKDLCTTIIVAFAAGYFGAEVRHSPLVRRPVNESVLFVPCDWPQRPNLDRDLGPPEPPPWEAH